MPKLSIEPEPSGPSLAELERYTIAILGPKEITEADLPVPDHASSTVKAIAHGVRSMTNRKLADGSSLHHCLASSAIGRDALLREVQALGYDIKDRKTIAAGLLELQELGVLTRVGQMDSWIDDSAQEASKVRKSGAYLYKLNLRFRELSSEILDALIAMSAAFGGATSPRRAHKAFEWAVKNAKSGCRNAIGFWLACRCRDAGLNDVEARPLMRSYAAQMSQSGHPYTFGEAAKSLASAYRRPKKMI